MMRYVAALLTVLLLPACATGIPLQNYAPTNQPKEDFTFCYGYSCKSQKQAGFIPKEWASVRSIFETRTAKTAEAERSKIARAIAKMETIIGAKTGTSHDLPEARGKKEDPAQMDCLDETINTSRYLEFLSEDGLLKFHRRADPVHRGYFVDGAWPHNTAVVQEIKSRKEFVVDSFYRANGEEPYIITREAWLAGWKPKGAKQ